MDVSLQAGRIVGEHWRLRGQLSVVGTSRFWEAEELRTDGHVVIEFSCVDVADPQARLRFSRETSVLTSFRSTYVVRTLDRGLIGDRLAFTVTEMLRGEDLARLLARESALELSDVAHIVDQACRGISRLDAVRIPHRVLEPKHVFLVTDPANARVVKLLNIGLGRGNTRASASVSPYLSPEPASIAPQVWAIGVMAYRMLAGALPFVTDDQRTRDAVRRTRFARLREARTDLPRELDEWFQTAMDPDPSQRFATVEQAGLAFGHIASTYASGRAARLRRLVERTSPKPPPLRSKSAERDPVAATPSGRAAVVGWERVAAAASERAAVVDRGRAAATASEHAASADWDRPDATRNECTTWFEWDPVVAATERAVVAEWGLADAPPSARSAVLESENSAPAAHAGAAAVVDRHQGAVTDQHRAVDPPVAHEQSMDAEQERNAQTAHERTTVASRVHASATRRKRVAASERAASFAYEHGATDRLPRTASASADQAAAASGGRTAARLSRDAATSVPGEHGSARAFDRFAVAEPEPDAQSDDDPTRAALDREHLAIMVCDVPDDDEPASECDVASGQKQSASLTYRGNAPVFSGEHDLGIASYRPTLVRNHGARSESSVAELARAHRAERARWRASAALAVLLGLLGGFALRSFVSNQQRSAPLAGVDRPLAEEGIPAHSISETSPQPTAAEPPRSAPPVIEPAASPARDAPPLAPARSPQPKRGAASALALSPRAPAGGSSSEFLATRHVARSARELGQASSARLVAPQPTQVPSDELLDPASPQRVSTATTTGPTAAPAESTLSPSEAPPVAARPAPPLAALRPPDATPVYVYRGF